MTFIDAMKEKARKDIKNIVLPEADDVRVLKATEMVLNEGFANIMLIGDTDEIKNLAKENNINIVKYDLKEGFILDNYIFISEYELYNKKKETKRRKFNFNFATRIKDLNKLLILGA